MITIWIHRITFSILTTQNLRSSEDKSINFLEFLDTRLKEYIEKPRVDYWKPPEIETFYHYYYSQEEKMLHFNKGVLEWFIYFLKTKKCEYSIKRAKVYEPLEVRMSLLSGIKDRGKQGDYINYMCNTKYPLICLPLQTGTGKTYCAIRYIVTKKLRTFIIVPANLQEQWIEEITKFTSLSEDDIYIIKGKESLARLQPGNNYPKYKIYLSTVNTLYRYVTYKERFTKDRVPLDKLLEHLEIGIKIIDEVHLNFKQHQKIDLATKVKYNVYLTATFYRTETTSNKIFQQVYRGKYRYKEEAYDRYINITECIYYGLGYISPNSYKTKKGYSEIGYEKAILKNAKLSYLLKNTIWPILEEKFLDIKDPGEKCLILIKLKKFGEAILNSLLLQYTEQLKDLRVGVFFSEHTKEYRAGLDIIISTNQSSGVGHNIEGLRTILIVENFNSKAWLYQCIGRLRKLKSGNIPECVYYTNADIKSHIFYRWNRQKELKKVAKSLSLIKIY